MVLQNVQGDVRPPALSKLHYGGRQIQSYYKATLLLMTRPTTLTTATKFKGSTYDLPGVDELAQTYFETHFLLGLPHCLPFPLYQKRRADGLVVVRSGFLRGCTRCVHLGLFEHE